MEYKTDIEIAQACEKEKITAIAERAGIPEEYLELYGNYKAKIDYKFMRDNADRPDGKLILVTAITPTPAGEGKTTTSVGLTDGLRKLGKNAMVALREPSLGPVFGVKGGAAGGGYAQVVPMEDINLHFTGDFHAIGAANNLLAAMLDNHIQQGNALGIDPKQITWKRAVDMNDRQLRHIVDGLGGRMQGVPPRGRLRDNRRQRGHGRAVLGQRHHRSQGEARAHHRRLHLRRQAGHGSRHQGRGRYGGAPEGRAQAEPGTDA